MLNPLKWLRGKSDPGSDPRTSGGWEILRGIFDSRTWTLANDIFKRYGAREFESLYAVQTVTYSCVKKICMALGEAPLRVGVELRTGWRDMPKHPIEMLLKRPNADMDYPTYIWHVAAHLFLTGETYVWKWRNAAGEVAELWPLPTSYLTPIRGAGGIVGYEIAQGGNAKPLTVAASEIVRIIFPDPSDPTRGLGPLQAATKHTQSDDESVDYMQEMLVNLRQPGLIFTQPTGWSDDQKKEVREIILNGLAKGKRGSPLFMEGEGAKVDSSVPLKDLDWPGLSQLNETRICSAFGVPPMLIGLRSGQGSQTFANYEQARKAFYEETVKSTWNHLASGHTRGLLIDEGETRLECYADTTAVEALKENENERMASAQGGFTAGLLTRNESRALLNLPALDEALDGLFVRMDGEIVPLTAVKPEPVPADDGKHAGEQL